MSAFLLFAAIAFLVYEFIAFAQLPTSGVSPIRLGGLTINFDAATAQRWRLGLRILIFFLILTAILLLHQFGSETILGNIWANRTAIILGLFFGALFAIWINRIFAHTAGDALTKGQIVAGIGLIVLFIVGSAGNDFSTLIQQISRKISTIKVGGAEIALQVPRKAPGEALAVISTPVRTASFGGSSAGLGLLVDLKDEIERDCGYIGLSFDQPPTKCAGSAVEKKLSLERDFTEATASDYAGCLAEIYDRTDPNFVNMRLEALASPFRELVAPGFDRQTFPDRATMTLYQETVRLAAYVLPAVTPTSPVGDRCKKAVAKLCQQDASCIEQVVKLVSTNFSTESKKDSMSLFSAFEGDLRPIINKFLDDTGGNNFRDQPYSTIAYADVMAQLRQYSAALQALYGWLERHQKNHSQLKDPSSLKTEDIHLAWFSVRTRSIIASFAEEWIRSFDSSAPTVLRDTHLDNLKTLLELMSQIPSSKVVLEFLKKPKYDLAGADFRAIPDESASNCPHQDIRKSQIVLVYLYNQLTFAYNALHHPKYDTDFAAKTKARVEQVMNADMSCVAKIKNENVDSYDQYLALRADALDLEAQVLWREAMSKRREAINDGREVNRDATLKSLYLARTAAALGRKHIEARYRAIYAKQQNADFAERVTPSKITESYESLEATSASISNEIQQIKESD